MSFFWYYSVMRIIGIDPGSALCGWAIVEKRNNGDCHLVASGCIKTKAGTAVAKRLQILFKELTAIIKKYQPQEAAVEELFFVQNIKTGIAVGQARGVVLLALEQAKIAITEYKPTQIKISITGYGHADKKQMQSMVKNILGARSFIRQDDEADAVAIALCHANQSTYKNKIALLSGH